MRLWDSRTGTCIGKLEDHFGSVIFSPDRSRLASASYDNTVRQNGCPHSSASPSRLCPWHFPGWLVSASCDHTVCLWDRRTGDDIVTLDGNSDCGTSVTFPTDGSRHFSRSNDNGVLLWDIADITGLHLLCKKTTRGLFYSCTHNSLSLLKIRMDPALCCLTMLIWEMGASLTRVIYWFPPDISPRLIVHPSVSMAAVVSGDGRLLLLDNSFCEQVSLVHSMSYFCASVSA